MQHIELDALSACMGMPGLGHIDADRLAPLGANAAHPGLSPPPDSETAHVASAGRIEVHGKSDTDIIGGDASDRKATTTLTAQFALLGYSLHELSDGSFVACKWGFSRPLQSMYEARRFCRQLGGAA